VNRNEIAAALLAIVREVYEDGHAVMGPRWTLLPKMTVLADKGDVGGMVRYFCRCIRSRKGQRAHDRLGQAGRKSLESEQTRFMAIARWYLWRQRFYSMLVLVALLLVVVLIGRLLR
jgi:hypothetical protein